MHWTEANEIDGNGTTSVSVWQNNIKQTILNDKTKTW